MDMWKYYDITHREHVVCNPTSEEKLARLVELFQLSADASVIDIACGKGEFLIRLVEAYGVRALGIDISPFFIADAKRRMKERVPHAKATFAQMDGADFRTGESDSFALAACIGASWVFGGHAGTLDALVRMVEPGGWVIVGEPYWLQEPPESYLHSSGSTREDFGTHVSNVEAGEQRGLELVHTLVSSKDDWDRYEGLQWHATAKYARAHPEDPDLVDVGERVARSRVAYLRWGRDTVGWAIYVFRHRAGGGAGTVPTSMQEMLPILPA
jgi:SAM-dependent methyltransferase